MSDVSHTSDSENSESLSPTLTVHRLKTILDEVRNHGKFFCIEQMEKQTTQLTNVIGTGVGSPLFYMECCYLGSFILLDLSNIIL